MLTLTWHRRSIANTHGDVWALTDRKALVAVAAYDLLNRCWRGDVMPDGFYVCTKTAAGTRKALERHIDTKSIGFFGVDNLHFEDADDTGLSGTG